MEALTASLKSRVLRDITYVIERYGIDNGSAAYWLIAAGITYGLEAGKAHDIAPADACGTLLDLCAAIVKRAHHGALS